MLNPIITPPRVPLVDPATGLISRAWYLFFLSLNNVANAVVDDPIVSPSAESLIASYDALLQTLAQEVQTQPTQEGALDQIAELQKQIASLELQPRNELGTIATQNANAVAITGGTIDNTVIGGTTPAAGTFTTLGVTTSIDAVGTDPDVNLLINSKGTGSTIFNSANGEHLRIFDRGLASVVNYAQISGATNTNAPRISGQGSGANVPLFIGTKGTSQVAFYTNNFNQEQMRVAHTASAVNYVQVTGAATTGTPVVSAQGSDTNIRLSLSSKGTSAVRVVSNNGAVFDAIGVSSAANLFNFTNSVAGSAPFIGVVGTDTNIDLALTPKGTGNVRFGTRTASADAPVTGYLEIKDSGGTIRRLAIIG
jgi:hypothetical protein